jgi:hypothetical protein
VGGDELGDEGCEEGGEGGQGSAGGDLHYDLGDLNVGRLAAHAGKHAAAPQPLKHHEVPDQQNGEEEEVVGGGLQAVKVVQRLLKVVYLFTAQTHRLIASVAFYA